ncbi:MAG: hypothetical protein J6T83_04590, partial [Paludibacteraceae bacterium]|nr:hypothetical protein [Paludibacteraceae bacterium]
MKFSILGLGLLLCFSSLNATVKYMTVELKNNDKYSFVLSKKPVLTHRKNELLIYCGGKTSYSISDVKNYRFTESDETKTETLDSDVVVLSSIDESTINVQNVAQGTIITLMNINGVVLSLQQTTT